MDSRMLSSTSGNSWGNPSNNHDLFGFGLMIHGGIRIQRDGRQVDRIPEVIVMVFFFLLSRGSGSGEFVMRGSGGNRV